MTGAPLRIAMWSGPRSLSTALMRAFGNRADTAVVDEPFYAAYLRARRPDHPGIDDVLARHEADWRKVAAMLTGPVPGGRRVFYQKHMSHHLLPGIGRDWMAACVHAFLIRDPAEVVASLGRTLGRVTAEDTGLPQQLALHERLAAETGRPPPVIDARDLQENPEGVLRALCAALGLPFDAAMLSWLPGPRPTDGAWARHWYRNVWASTGFAPYRPPAEPVPDALAPLAARLRPLYERLWAGRLTAA